MKSTLHLNRGALAAFVVIAWLSHTPTCLAQTQDIQGGEGLNGIGDARAKTALMSVLQKSVDIDALGKGCTLKEVCGELYQVLAKNGDKMPILVEVAAFAGEIPNGGDILDAPVALPRIRGSMTVAAILNHMVGQLPGGNGVLCLGGPNPNYVQITTKKALASEATATRLSDKVDMSDFKKQMPLREALGKLGVRMVLENDAFKSGPVAGDRVLDVMVAFPADGDFTVARFLEIALKQVPEAEATFVVHADCIEITSQQRAAMLRSLLRQREMQAHAPPNRVMK